MGRFKKYLEDRFSVTAEEWLLISGYAEEIRLDRNEFFIRHGKVCRNSGVILEGVMRYFERDQAGNEPTCYFTFEDHYIVDPFTFSTQVPSSINLQSVTPCAIAMISYEADRQLALACPRWKEIASAMLLEVTIEFANQKTMTSLNAAERYAYFVEHYPSLALRVPLGYIASYLGIAQASLSRLRKNVSKKG